eukprot:scaffold78014_cov75-Phaeocystis_antarctica.AAC.2
MRAVVAHASGHRRHALLPDVLPRYLLALQLLAVLLLVTQREHLLVGGHAEGVWTIGHGAPHANQNGLWKPTHFGSGGK